MKKILLLLALFVGLLAAANEIAFEYQSTLLEETVNYRVFHVTYDSPEAPFWEEARQVKAFYYEPKMLPPEGAHAVLCLHILGGNGQLTKSIAAFFADHGMPALMPQMPLFLERCPPGNTRQLMYSPQGPDYLLATMRATPGDIKRSIDFLASRPGVDPYHMNIIGTSMGGLLAVSTFAQDERLDKAVFLLAGGNLKTILVSDNREAAPIHAAYKNATPEQTAELDRLCDLMEPMNHIDALAPKAQEGRIRMYNAELDQIIPPAHSEALAKALGLTRDVDYFILPQVDHYTGVVALPRLLEEILPFFGGKAIEKQADAESIRLKGLFSALRDALAGSPADGKVLRMAMRFSVIDNGQERQAGHVALDLANGRGHVALADGKGLFGLERLQLGVGGVPWAVSPNGALFVGDGRAAMPGRDLLPEKFHLYRQMAVGMLGQIAATGSLGLLKKLLQMQSGFEGADGRTFVATGDKWRIEIPLEARRDVPAAIHVTAGTLKVDIRFDRWETAAPFVESDFTPPKANAAHSVDAEQLVGALRQMVAYAWERAVPDKEKPAAPALCTAERIFWAGKGLRIERPGEFPLLIFAGTPEEIGRQHGELCKEEIQRTYGCLRLVAGGYLLMKNEWFPDTILDVQKRTQDNLPERYLEELDAMSEAAGLTVAQGREIAFFPELFHCSGIAARGKATVDGKVVHVRVLDYMRDIGLQDIAQVQVYLPEDRIPWVTVGFAGFNGTVTAMNAEGLAMGEMGGGGEGNWDGLPMSYLMRRIMEECTTVEEAKKMLMETPLTCEYYYVLSDKSGDMVAVEARAGESPLFLAPGEEHPLLRQSFEDIAWITAPSRQEALCKRLEEHYGRLDVETMKEVVKRPVAMASNLHDAIFLPETLDLHFAYADATRPACDCPYHHLNLAELIRDYQNRLRERE